MKKGKDGIYNKYIKRLLDVVISFTALLVLSPLLLILTVVGAIAMRGTPFFTQKRPGMIDKKTGQERIIRVLKFRTMTNAKASDGTLLDDSARLTKYGRFLRSTSLDELPQLFNILTGSLSLIGPRPLLVSYLPYYTAEERHRHDVRPGLTGWAQVHGRNFVGWDKRLKLDCEYVENLSFGTDIKIIFFTVQKVLLRSDVSDTRIISLDQERQERKATL